MSRKVEFVRVPRKWQRGNVRFLSYRCAHDRFSLCRAEILYIVADFLCICCCFLLGSLVIPVYARNFGRVRYNDLGEEVYKKAVQFEELLCTLRQDYPNLVFKSGKRFMYRPPRTVVFEQSLDTDEACLQLLHEVGHAVLRHRDYQVDIDRIKMERAAWEQARRLCAQYNIYYDEGFVEAELDTYRDWLHRRSLCKRCGLTCYQLETGRYRCPRCDDLLAGTS